MSDHEPITCRELIEFLADYVDSSLPVESRKEFDRHLAECPSCVAYVQSYKQVIDLGRFALGPMECELSGPIPKDLAEAIRAARKKQP